MSQPSSEYPPGGTPPAEGTTPPHSAVPPTHPTSPKIDWTDLADEWIKYGNKVLERASTHAKANAARLESKTYGSKELLDDIASFWKYAAEDASDAVECVRDKFSTPPTTPTPTTPVTPTTPAPPTT